MLLVPLIFFLVLQLKIWSNFLLLLKYHPILHLRNHMHLFRLNAKSLNRHHHKMEDIRRARYKGCIQHSINRMICHNYRLKPQEKCNMVFQHEFSIFRSYLHSSCDISLINQNRWPLPPSYLPCFQKESSLVLNHDEQFQVQGYDNSW